MAVDTASLTGFGSALLRKAYPAFRLLQVLRETNSAMLVRYGAVGHPSDVNYGAGPTGGCDDIDDRFSGKSGANPAADAGMVRKTYHGGVRPDHMDFASIAREKALAQKPVICCPNCHNPVKELDSAQPKYVKPEGVEEEAPLHFVLHPCGCKVHPEWAGAFTKEVNRRIEGEVPLPVCAFKPEELDAKTRELEEKITTIMAERDEAVGTARQRLEYYLVIAVDELMRLLPGAHNRLPQIDALDPEVEVWAGKNKMQKPPVKRSSEFGYPRGYPNPLAPKDAGPVNLFGPGTAGALQSEASLFAKEEAMHTDPAVAAAGKEQLKRQRTAAQIKQLGGMLSRRTLAEVFNIDISAEQEELARAVAAQAKTRPAADLGHSKPPLHPGLQTMPVGPALHEELKVAGWDKSLLGAAREFLDRHNTLCLQLINEQVLGQPHTDTRHAAAWLVTIKRSIDQHLALGSAIAPEGVQILNLIVPVLLPATGMVPTKPGPALGLPLPVTTDEIRDDFHAQFAPARRRIVRKKDEA